MSVLEKAYGAIKTSMLVRESLDQLKIEMKDLSGDLAALGRSHAELAQRVAEIEGYIRGRADQAAAQKRQKSIEG